VAVVVEVQVDSVAEQAAYAPIKVLEEADLP
jgi:hypothetical protein